jgi:hypothetical protein
VRNSAPTRHDLYRHLELYIPNMLVLLDDKTAYINERGCLIWSGAPTGQMGYGQLALGPREDHLVIYAHRMSYMVHRGDPGDLSVLHHCDTPFCFNPEHLFCGTAGDNIRDAVAKGRHRNQNTGVQSCGVGHLLTPENVYEWNGTRRCLICRRAYQAAWRQNNAR